LKDFVVDESVDESVLPASEGDFLLEEGGSGTELDFLYLEGFNPVLEDVYYFLLPDLAVGVLPDAEGSLLPGAAKGFIPCAEEGSHLRVFLTGVRQLGAGGRHAAEQD
jgi:hypothetical protein